MIRYSSDVILKWDNKKNLFIVEEPFDVIRNGYGLFTVEVGFRTDLASIPQWATSLVPKLGHHLQPAVAHDYCYVHKTGLDKKKSDKLFYDGMISQGVRRSRAWLMYRAVRLGGKGRWVKE